MLHSKVAVGSRLLNVKVGVLSLLGLVGFESMVVSGAAVSIVHVYEAGDASVFPKGSTARTAKVCDPSAKVARVLGGTQAENAPPSMLHSKVAVASGLMNVNMGVALLLGLLGVEVIVVSGAVVSITQVYDAGVGSVLPKLSSVRTLKVCEPSAKGPKLEPEVQAAYAPPSTWHSNEATPEPLPSLPVNEKAGLLLLVGLVGLVVMVVSGADASIVHV